MILSKGIIKEINLNLLFESKVFSDQLESILILVPTNRKLRDLKKKIISNFKDTPVSQINLETLTTLTTKLLKENKGIISLSEAASTVLIKETVEQLDLSYFNSYTKGIPFGTLDKIKNVISEYKRHGITPLTLQNEAIKLSHSEMNKANDIAKIYELYLEKCDKLSALELGDIYSSLLKISVGQIQEYFKKHFINVDTIIFENFDEFTNLEIDIIDILSNCVNNNLIINIDYLSKNGKLFSHLDTTIENLNRKGFYQIEDKTPLEDSRFKNIIREKLFKDGIVKVEPKFSNSIFKISASSRIQEIEIIASQIKLEILNNGVLPENICIAFNIIKNYSSIIRDIFPKYGIPINLTDRVPLKTSQPVIAAISLLELVERDFYYTDLIRVLTNKFLHFPEIDVLNLMTVANELKITKGSRNWDLSISDAINLLKFNSETTVAEKEANLKKYKKAKSDIDIISTLLKPISKSNTKSDFYNLFKELLFKLRLPFTVIENSNGREEEFIKSVTVLLQTVDEVLNLLNPIDPDRKYPLHFYLEQLITISNWARYNVKEKSDYGVLVTSVDEIRGLKFDYLFLGGLCDGDFPTRYSPEIFFSGSFQKKDLIHQTEEKFHFYQTLCSWNKKIFLSSPQNDGESELVESTFVKDFQKLFQLSEIDNINIRDILTTEDLQIAYGQNRIDSQLRKSVHELGIDTEKLLSRIEFGERQKEDPFEVNQFNGYIGNEDNEINNFLEEYSERQFSVSQFETFAKCPFKYFSERILKLQPIEEPTEEAEPIELGNVLHSILYDFYSRVVNNKLPLGLKGTKEFENLKKMIFEIAEDKINKLNLNSPLAFFEKEKILGIEGNEENSILFQFLQTETASRGDFSPSLFEHVFGYFSNSDNRRDITIGDIKLRGKIDRIDIDFENGLYNVIDYKLRGKKPTRRELIEGLSLQLPLYLLAGETIVKDMTEEDFRGFRMIIYSLDFDQSNFGPLAINLSNKRKIDADEIIDLNENQIALTKAKIVEYHTKIKSGDFHLSKLEDRGDKVCKYCDYKSLCRVKEVFSE